MKSKLKLRNTCFILAIFAATGATGVCQSSMAATANSGARAPQAASVARPWEKAQAIVAATEADLSKSGIQGISARAADLEQILADANRSLKEATSGSGTMYVLTDSTAETILAMGLAAKTPGAAGRQAVAVANPYPSVGFYLGTYYN